MSYHRSENEQGVTLEPASPARATVIWLHGLGADGNDFVPIVPELKLPDELAVRFVFPHAEVRPVTLNGGMAMRAWYDIISLDRNGPQDEKGIRASAARIDSLIAEQVEAGIASDKILVAGFSQGGAIALHAGLRHAQRLAGVLGLSTYLPLEQHLAEEASAANREVPILLCHGSQDPMVPIQLGQHSCEALRQQGYAPQWQDYPMQHQVCLEEIQDISAWMQPLLG
ncbi:alpha/beta hydrolase-fold protein [Algiphilus sp.]|uniref:alpha/beta hydrolase n=1 Tax=Algiphilus sp. TaxID=1872431 RepID=UPI0032EB6771